MDQEAEERFKRIETNLEAASVNLKTTQSGIVETQQLLQSVVKSQQNLQNLFEGTQKTLSAYIDASNRGMKQMEADLAELVRVITADHSNGHQ